VQLPDAQSVPTLHAEPDAVFATQLPLEQRKPFVHWASVVQGEGQAVDVPEHTAFVPHEVPAARDSHVPTWPAVSQRWQSVLSLAPHAVLQHTPSAM
jgi:hypothetical protein